MNAVRLALVVALASGGCAISGTYEPKPSRRISAVDVPRRTFVRDGRRFELGLAGSPEDLVSGNDLAVAYARGYHHKIVTGLTLEAIALSAFTTGVVLVRTSGRSDDRLRAGTILTFTSLVPMLVSMFFLVAARSDLQSAVNIYNDGLEGPIAPNAFDDKPPPGGR